MKKILSIILSAVMLVSITAIAFANGTDKDEKSDISAKPILCSDWAVGEIEKAANMGILDWKKDDDFTNSITREEFCEIVYSYIKNVIGLEDIYNAGYHIVDTNSDAVKQLVNRNIIEGKSKEQMKFDGPHGGSVDLKITFAPNDYLTREEAATILDRLLTETSENLSMTTNHISFADSADISDWAGSAIQVMAHFGIMNGVGDNKFAPKETYTTEQAIATVVRMYNANSYKYVTSLGTVTSKTDYSSHINFATEANVRIDVIKEYKKFDDTRYIIPGPFKAFTDQQSSMYITFDSFAKIFNGKWELNNNVFQFTYDISKDVVMEKYTPNETSGEWPNKTGSTPVVNFSDITTILVNGIEKEIKASFGGKVYNSSLMMYNDELYIPVQMIAELLDYDISVTDIIWN